MIKFSGEAGTYKVQSGLGFSGENEEVIRSLSLNCNIASLPPQRPKNSRSLINVT
jgi:hypothetical protein